ncbi:MAG: EcsC family protein [Planctomycetes bacterium]|nr:EcsC family protein [Planctomycetota bacterium]
MPPQSLTDFEQERVESIAGWKAEPPSYLSALLDKITRPLVVATEHLVPPEKIAAALDTAYASSEIHIHQEKVARAAGVENVRDLRNSDLQLCDRLANTMALEASKGAMFWGAGAGGANLLATLISLNATLTYCLRTIHTIGYCYGFGTDEPHERDFVLGVLLVASASTLKEKQDALATFAKIEDLVFEEAFEDLLKDTIREQIVSTVGLSTIPLAGMLAGAMHSAALTEHTAAVAKFCFEERWLRQRRGIERIAPDRMLARSLVGRVRARVANNVYWGAFGTSFVVCVPFAWLLQWIPRQNVVSQGLVNGRDHACSDVEQLTLKWKGESEVEPRAATMIELAGA